MMKDFITEMTVSMGDGNLKVFSPNRAVIRYRDEAAGGFLAVRGVNDEPDDEEREDEFYLQSHEDIDEFCALLHKALGDVDGKDKGSKYGK